MSRGNFLKKASVAFLTAGLIFSGCGKDDDDNDGKISGGRGVYVAGYVGEFRDGVFNQDAVVWKNGKRHNLQKESYAEALSVYVSGNDVYVAGFEFDVNNFRTAILWKNGIRQVLPSEESARAYSVYVSGNDVYVAGVDNSTPILWKNGERQVLSGNTGNPDNIDVFVSGTDVYVAGDNSLWKNDTREALQFFGARSVFVSGSDVYVAGYTYGSTPRGRLWKNGTIQSIDFDATSVFVSGADVYVTGVVYSGDNSPIGTAKLWKNGVMQDLQGGGEVNSVFVSDNDVYAAGARQIGNFPNNDALVWKNNEQQVLASAYTTKAYSVFVVK